jgi:hypothetical protein
MLASEMNGKDEDVVAYRPLLSLNWNYEDGQHRKADGHPSNQPKHKQGQFSLQAPTQGLNPENENGQSMPSGRECPTE